MITKLTALALASTLTLAPALAVAQTAEVGTPAPARTRMRSPGLTTAGFVLIGLGVASVVTGAVIWNTTKDCLVTTCDRADRESNSRKTTAVLATGFGGLGMAVAGVPLVIVGSRSVPAAETSLRVGPGSVAVRGTF
jgi:hypothetical protein